MRKFIFVMGERTKFKRCYSNVHISQKGSHVKFRKFGEKILTVIVPANKKEIPVGTFRSILRQSQLHEKDFEK